MPTFKGLKEENLYYKGILTFSLTVTDNGPVLLDYHVRLNDPATQAMVAIINNDLCELMLAMKHNTLKNIKRELNGKSAVAVVIASDGYPEDTKVGQRLSYIPPQYMSNAIDNGTLLFFGAVESRADGIYTTGGRAATIVGIDTNIMQANTKAYDAINLVSFDGSWHRSDIGEKFFENMTDNK